MDYEEYLQNQNTFISLISALLLTAGVGLLLYMFLADISTVVTVISVSLYAVLGSCFLTPKILATYHAVKKHYGR